MRLFVGVAPPPAVLDDLDTACAPLSPLRDDLRCDDLEWERGKAWAFQQAMGLVWYYAESNPVMSLLGRRTLRRLEQGWAAQ